MRPVAEFFTVSHLAGAPTAAQHSPWQSPVPYLFGGLAAMLGLIAFALLILACSYWKLSGFLDGDRDGQAAGDADGEKGSASGASKPALDFQEHVVVIMAGDERPTFLAKPVTRRAAEVELAAAAAPASASAADDGQEKEVDEQGCEVRPQLGADAASRRRDHHDAASQSRDHGHDAASQSHNHHHDHDHDHGEAAGQSRDQDHDAASRSHNHNHHHHHHHDHDLESSGTTALQENRQ